MCKGYFSYAKYTDDLHQSVIATLSSAEWTISQQLKKHKEEELDEYKELLKSKSVSKTSAPIITRHITQLAKQIQSDKAEVERINKNKHEFLYDAIGNYVNCLITGSKYDVQAVFRLCSLWFSNTNISRINEFMKT